MIEFHEATVMHDALQWDGIFTPKEQLVCSLDHLSDMLERAISSFQDKTTLIVMPWEVAQAFRRRWETEPLIKAVRPTDRWLWGHVITFKGIDVLATPLASSVWVTTQRDLRKIWDTEDCVVTIEVQNVPVA